MHAMCAIFCGGMFAVNFSLYSILGGWGGGNGCDAHFRWNECKCARYIAPNLHIIITPVIPLLFHASYLVVRSCARSPSSAGGPFIFCHLGHQTQTGADIPSRGMSTTEAAPSRTATLVTSASGGISNGASNDSSTSGPTALRTIVPKTDTTSKFLLLVLLMRCIRCVGGGGGIKRCRLVWSICEYIGGMFVELLNERKGAQRAARACSPCRKERRYVHCC